jgi:hypothetical protein
MTEDDAVCEVLRDMDDELHEREKRLSSSLGYPIEVSEASDSLLTGLGYTIGQKDRSEDAISGVSGWVYDQKDDDAMKVSNKVINYFEGALKYVYTASSLLPSSKGIYCAGFLVVRIILTIVTKSYQKSSFTKTAYMPTRLSVSTTRPTMSTGSRIYSILQLQIDLLCYRPNWVKKQHPNIHFYTPKYLESITQRFLTRVPVLVAWTSYTSGGSIMTTSSPGDGIIAALIA